MTKDYYDFKSLTNIEMNKCLRIEDYKEETRENRQKFQNELDEIHHNVKMLERDAKRQGDLIERHKSRFDSVDLKFGMMQDNVSGAVQIANDSVAKMND